MTVERRLLVNKVRLLLAKLISLFKPCCLKALRPSFRVFMLVASLDAPELKSLAPFASWFVPVARLLAPDLRAEIPAVNSVVSILAVAEAI